MKNNYQEKREHRIEWFKELASKNFDAEQQLFDRANKMASVIPMGQPILVGHHSEKSDRAYRNKIHNTMGKAVEAGQKANYYQDRAEAAENNYSISSDNPDAINELEKKLAGLIEQQETWKKVNKILKAKKKSEVHKLADLGAAGLERYSHYLNPDSLHGIGIPSYRLTNNNGNMGRIKQRIEQLKRIAAMTEKEITVNNVRIFSSPDTNRVQMFFPDKPSEEIRTELKRSGFRWAPSEGAWQKFLSSYAEQQANAIALKY